MPVFERIRAGFGKGIDYRAEMFGRLTGELSEHEHAPFQRIVVDEAQDVSVPS